ncbi:hypothetical protein JZ751_018805 [Albula glossodonta]|uniref:Uncharacterized protein n=1 Tax=Albula glossodonta TaxID=121402 RepID=A0A8T2NNB0_9TELE|nr:hypothetical protein JZ751_018805 [Albula glossodonta]
MMPTDEAKMTCLTGVRKLAGRNADKALCRDQFCQTTNWFSSSISSEPAGSREIVAVWESVEPLRRRHEGMHRGGKGIEVALAITFTDSNRTVKTSAPNCIQYWRGNA